MAAHKSVPTKSLLSPMPPKLPKPICAACSKPIDENVFRRAAVTSVACQHHCMKRSYWCIACIKGACIDGSCSVTCNGCSKTTEFVPRSWWTRAVGVFEPVWMTWPLWYQRLHWFKRWALWPVVCALIIWWGTLFAVFLQAVAPYSAAGDQHNESMFMDGEQTSKAIAEMGALLQQTLQRMQGNAWSATLYTTAMWLFGWTTLSMGIFLVKLPWRAFKRRDPHAGLAFSFHAK